jgi:formate dehydrogenase major subunit
VVAVPRGSSSLDLVAGPARETKVKYRRPGGTEWEELELDTAMDMIADRVIAARERTWEEVNDEGTRSTGPGGSRASGAPRWTTKRTT